MRTTKRLLSIAVSALIFTSCKKENAGAPSGVDFQLRATNTIAALQRTDAATIQWTAGTATPTSVKFEAKKDATEVEFTSTSGQQVNLFTVAQSTFGNLTLPDGTYNEIELKIQLNGSTSVPALELNGTYNNGTANIPVVFKVTTPLQIKAEKNNVAITSGAFTAVTSLDLSSFTTGISQAAMNSATQTGGSIVISSASNANLYNIIISNIDRFHHAEFEHH
jgi:PBP1b-binding outer membrane lipoprotein LpoB